MLELDWQALPQLKQVTVEGVPTNPETKNAVWGDMIISISKGFFSHIEINVEHLAFNRHSSPQVSLRDSQQWWTVSAVNSQQLSTCQ